MCYTAFIVNDRENMRRWYEGVRGTRSPKIITGLRGIGKSAFLEELHGELRAQGVSRRRVVLLDSGSPRFRRLSTGAQVANHIAAALPKDGPVQLLVREAAGFPHPDYVMAFLARNPNWDVVATCSSRRLIGGALERVYGVPVDAYEVFPPAGRHAYSADAARARWNEIFLKDVLAQAHFMEVMLVDRVGCWLSDNIGDTISLRLIANAVSPGHRAISPHTVGSYLDALVDANIVCKASRWDTGEDAPLTTGYRYYFADPDLRLAHFGSAPVGERRRMALNRAWLWLRRQSDEVFSASGRPEVDFVTRTGETRAYWHVDVEDDGAVVRLC